MVGPFALFLTPVYGKCQMLEQLHCNSFKFCSNSCWLLRAAHMWHQVLQQLRKVAADLGSSSAAAAVGVDRRAELRAGVFRPGHNLPTRSLAEQADIEVAEARAREEVGCFLLFAHDGATACG